MTIEDRLEKYLGQKPKIDSTSYIADSAKIMGDVQIGAYSSIWHNCVLRADINSIVIGEATNIQDGAIIHVADEFPTLIGDYNTIGHGAVIHACKIEDECLIGINAIILDGVHVGSQSIIGASALVTRGMNIPPGSVVMGKPGRVVRMLSPEEQSELRFRAEKYIKVSKAHKQLDSANIYSA